MDVAERAVFELAESLRILGVGGWTLPNIKEKFVESSDDKLELGRVGTVTVIEAEIVFDEKFKTKELQKEFEEVLSYQGWEYPGMERVYKHELAHLVLWSVTKLPQQPVVRLLDEGWATLVEYLGTKEATNVAELIEFIKFKVQNIKSMDLSLYERCLDLEHPVSERVKEDLQGAEYFVGAALLLWVYEVKGLEAMIDLLRKSPSTSRRTSSDRVKIFSALDPKVHAGFAAYQKGIVEPLRRGELTEEGAIRISEFARKWEAAQFRSALLEVTNFESVAIIREEFEKWLNNYK
jgi:predicted SprT family Zn-dependent metalloprotease